MATFGDNSTSFMRGGQAAGFRIEAGCWTQGNGDASAHIPTTFVEIFSFICVPSVPNEIPDISDGHIKCSLDAANNVELNYIATGY